eukprot:SAG25_NODE_475_length_7563_cov_88.041667_2_plen_135_part_00
MHTHHLLYGVLTQYLSPGPCLVVVDFGPHRDRLWLMLSHESCLPCLPCLSVHLSVCLSVCSMLVDLIAIVTGINWFCQDLPVRAGSGRIYPDCELRALALNEFYILEPGPLLGGDPKTERSTRPGVRWPQPIVT